MGKKLTAALGLIKSIAPTVATALGTPMAGAAVSAVLGALGTDSEAEAVRIIQRDPEALAKLKSAELQFESDMAKLDVDIYALDVESQDSARKMAVGTTIIPQIALTVLFSGGYFWLLSVLFNTEAFGGLDDWIKGQLGVLIGVMTTIMVQQMNFWFGSSKGSKDKTDALRRTS